MAPRKKPVSKKGNRKNKNQETEDNIRDIIHKREPSTKDTQVTKEVEYLQEAFKCAHDEYTFRDLIKEIIINQYEIEKRGMIAIEEVSTTLQQLGTEVIINTTMEGYMYKLADLRLLKRLSNAYGMDAFQTEKIMDLEINNKFNPKPYKSSAKPPLKES